MMSRLFIALDIPQKKIEDIINIRNEIYDLEDNIKWEDLNKFHITIKFLGDVGENMLNLISNKLEEINFNKIETHFTKFELFYKNKEPKILWVGINLNENLSRLKEIIEDHCELMGFPKEANKFKPHLTLLRIKGKEDLSKIEKFLTYRIDSNFVIDSFSLLKSTLYPQGSMYNLVKKYNLI